MKEKIVIDLTQETLNESWLRMFGSAIESILGAMFGGSSIPVSIRGSRGEVNAFVNTLSREKRYMDAYKKFGLDNPNTFRSKFELNKSVKDFERKTGLIWPFR